MSEPTNCDCAKCRCEKVAEQLLRTLPAQGIAILAVGTPNGNVAVTLCPHDDGIRALSSGLKAVAISLDHKHQEWQAGHNQRN